MMPPKVFAKERGEIDFERMSGLIRGVSELDCLVEREIEINDPSQLVTQLAQVVIGCVHRILILVDEVELSELNQSYVMYKFQYRLINNFKPMISGEKEFDGSYDEEEKSVI